MAYLRKRRLYEALPAPFKLPFGWIPFGLRGGRSYREVIRRARLFEQAGAPELLRYQSEELAKLLEFASDQVPAYTQLRSLVARLPPFEALKAFPLIAKADLQENMPAYLPRDFARIAHYESTTGGTTGNQLSFYLDDASQSRELGFIHRLWTRVGYRPSSRKATFRGVEFPDLRPRKFWRRNPIYNELQFSPFHMNDQTLPLYWERLLRFRPEYLHGYPSAISLLADFVQRHSLPAEQLGLRAVLLGSEALYPEQRQIIEQALRTRAFSWYGHSERAILGGECEHAPAYHQFPDYGVLEIIDESGKVVTTAGERGELVGTGLINRSLPLIRYRTEDHARLLPRRCECGREFDRFDEVEGRWKQEFVIGRNGSRISPAALNMHGPLFANIVRYQYFQSQPGRMELRLMVSEGFGPADEAALLAAYRRKTGEELQIEIRVVPDIPLTARGKLRRLIQELPESAGR